MPGDRHREEALQVLDSPRPLLKPRLAPPALPEATVTRVEIRERLEAGEDRCATLLRAPAGFGKTVAAADWALSRDGPTAWLGLERSDNDPAEFLRYLLGALIHAGIPSDLETTVRLLEAADRADPDALLSEFVNQLMREPARQVLVLEHYDYIENPGIHRLVEFLLNQLQGNLRLVFISRIEPPLDIPRLRACGRLSEIRASVFRFSDQEVRELFGREAHVDLSSREVRFLQTRLVGWAAGLQATAHELRFGSSQADIRSAYERALPSLQAFALNQFLEHCAAQDILTLERLSELVRLDPASASIFAPELRGRDFMGELMAAGVPLQVNRPGAPSPSYSLHPVLQQALRCRLRKGSGMDLPNIHRKAAVHFHARGEPSHAVAHMLCAAVELRNLSEREPALELVGDALRRALDSRLRPTSIATMAQAAGLIREWSERAEGEKGGGGRQLLDYAQQVVDFLSEEDLEAEDKADSPDTLSDREREVMDLLADGRTSAAIAGDLILSPHTVRTHVKNIYRKLRVHSRVEAVERARELGLLH